MQNVTDTIISQYQNSPTLLQLIESMNGYIDPSADFDTFYTVAWNLDTVTGFGLDILGRIVGISRVLQVGDGSYLGFEEALPGSGTFDNGVFYAGGSATGNYALSDDAFRLVVTAKALANITNGSAPSLNKILLTLFPGRGNCYATDNGGMQMTYTFTFPLSAVELAIVNSSGVLPRPTGVSLTTVHP